MGAIIKMQPIRSAVSSAACLSSCEAGVCYSAVTTGYSGQSAYAGMHLLSSASGVAWTMSIESATSCAFASPSTRFTFTSQTCVGAQMAAPIARPSAGTTDVMFWRAKCVPASTSDFRLGLIWVGFQ